MKSSRRLALTATICLWGCATAKSNQLTLDSLRAAIAVDKSSSSYQHNLQADLDWMDQLPLIQRLARDINRNEARFLAVDDGKWRVPGVPGELYCLIGPTSMRPIPLEDASMAQRAAVTERMESFIIPYNRMLAEYYAAEFGWNCEEPKS